MASTTSSRLPVEVARRTCCHMQRILYYLLQRCQYEWNAFRLKRLPWTAIDRHLTEIFLSSSRQDEERYAELFSYLVTGLLHYGTSDCAHVYYPGALSFHSAATNAMEGFCRTLPMIGAWVCSGRPSVIRAFDGRQIDLIRVARTGLLAGTNPLSKGFWGKICDHDQRIVEAADVALSVWLLRDHLWPQLSEEEKETISSWLLSLNGKAVYHNNWHLFPVIVNEVLSSLGCDGDRALSLKHYEAFKSFYRGDGWFSDGPDGALDYYNAWGMHYALFWINLISPGMDRDFIDRGLTDFVRYFLYFFSTDGIPITGRSICYRMAAPAPLVAAAVAGIDCVSTGIARRALDCIWRYFLARGAVQRGRITQGYYGENVDLLDIYSGPGSPMWSTRSLTIAFYSPPDSDFWTSPLERLPVEQEDYRISIPAIQWEIRGIKQTREVQIIKKNNIGNQVSTRTRPSRLYRLLTHVLGLPFRSQDPYNQYELHTYSSIAPFWLTGGCSPTS